MYGLNSYWFRDYTKYGLPTVIVSIDTGTLIKVNKEVLDALNINCETPADLEGRCFTDIGQLSTLDLKEVLVQIQADFVRVIESGNCVPCIYNFNSKGELVTISVLMFPIRDVDGNIGDIAVILLPNCTLEDMAVITHLHKELETEQRRLHLLIDSAPFGCVVFDTEFKPIACNTVCVDLFEEQSKTSLLSNITRYLFAGICDIEQSECYSLMRDNVYANGSFQMSATHLKADGDFFEASMTFTLVKHCDDEQIVAYIVDMTEQRKVLDMYTELALSASMDKLTGVKNRGHFDTKMRVMMAEHKVTEKPLYLVMLDIDDFKQINDTYGHVVGDEVLKGLGAALISHIRPLDCIARYGGEEFVIILENMSINAVRKKIESLLSTIENLTIPVVCGGKQLELNITVSLGLAQFNSETMVDAEDFCECADRALYQAKNEGKNCYRMYSE